MTNMKYKPEHCALCIQYFPATIEVSIVENIVSESTSV
uniref:Uncharacterized protein n=1 Tax=Arundo donax TaxID=35708 RepID=A0A0A9FRS4_ARUDO